ncbi:hypothetical protein V9T40_010913 [Parthenolecanium corni]|uniref:Iron-binding zinc finger CDGSH type domain-containing protein n=1 Tax=Parthenolecanium corni TaxID=536013 RepID=A0AAN9T4G2_9HEMI
MNLCRLVPSSLRMPVVSASSINGLICQNIRVHSTVRNKSSKTNEVEIPKNILESKQTAHLQPDFGVPYDCKPFKMLLDKDKKYSWCSCGQGHSQPLCDGTHRKFPQLNIKLKPVRFQVAETKDYWLCNCKQTKNRPFCDGSHRDPVIIEACKFKHVCTG